MTPFFFEKVLFFVWFLSLLSRFSLFVFSDFLLVWQMWQQKTLNSRVYARTRKERDSKTTTVMLCWLISSFGEGYFSVLCPFCPLRIFTFFLPLWQRYGNYIVVMEFCKVWISKMKFRKRKDALFCVFFSLWACFEVYTCRRTMAQSLRSDLHLTINPNRSLDRYDAICYREYNFLSSFIFLLVSCCSLDFILHFLAMA